MLNLRLVNHAAFTDNILKILSHSRVTTVLEFLQEDAEKLAILTKLSLSDIISIRSHIFSKYSAPLVNGATLFKSIKTKKRCIQTGIESLNSILNGGIPVSHITELCGLADSGKTQLCFQLAINCVRHTNAMILYIDTKGDFSAIRVQKILEAEELSHKDMALIMYKIKIVHLWSMDEIIELLQKIKNKTLIFDNLALIIVDSLPCLMFQHLGDDNKIGLVLLNTFVNYCRFISKDMQLAIVCVNLQTRWVDQDVPEIDEDEKDQSVLIKETAYVEKRNRCLGNYWRHVPAVVLSLEKAQSTKAGPNFNIVVTKIKPADEGMMCCNLFLSSSGVS